MRIKADRTSYLHDLKRRQMDVAFRRCPANLFKKGLELGAGEGTSNTDRLRFFKTYLSMNRCLQIRYVNWAQKVVEKTRVRLPRKTDPPTA
jgi:hypothetical protein